MILRKYCIFIALIFINCVESFVFKRSKRGAMNLRELVCHRHPERSYCKPHSNLNTAAEVGASPAQPAPKRKARTREEYCATFKPQFVGNCQKHPINRNYYNFCSAYAKQCGVLINQQGTQQSAQANVDGKLKLYCNTYWNHFASCKVQPVDKAIIQFCNDYSKLCGQPLQLQVTQQDAGPLPSNLPLPPKFPTPGASSAQQPNVQQFGPNVQQPGPNFQQQGTNFQQPGPSFQQPGPNAQPNNAPNIPEGSVSKETCVQYEEQADYYCRNNDIIASMVNLCRSYFYHCEKHLFENSPLKKVSQLFNSGVGISQGQQVRGIPFYPFNNEGAVGTMDDTNVDFGSWGGGVSQTQGVRDFFETGSQTGANWYEGKYGSRNNWNVPIVPWINGGSGTQVDVPLTKEGFGNVGVNSGSNVGNFFGMNDGVGVDWANGDVGLNKGFEVPIIGLTAQQKSGISFPSVNDFSSLGGTQT